LLCHHVRCTRFAGSRVFAEGYRLIDARTIAALRHQGLELRGERLAVRTPIPADAQALDEMLCTDAQLRQALGSERTGPPDAARWLADTEGWCERTNSISFAIVDEQGCAIGMISLSHVDEATRTARCGYFIESSCRGQGYTTEAFGLVVSLARRLGLKSLSATVAADNTASLRIWLRHDATTEGAPNGKLRCTIGLAPEPNT